MDQKDLFSTLPVKGRWIHFSFPFSVEDEDRGALLLYMLRGVKVSEGEAGEKVLVRYQNEKAKDVRTTVMDRFPENVLKQVCAIFGSNEWVAHISLQCFKENRDNDAFLNFLSGRGLNIQRIIDRSATIRKNKAPLRYIGDLSAGTNSIRAKIEPFRAEMKNRYKVAKRAAEKEWKEFQKREKQMLRERCLAERKEFESTIRAHGRVKDVQYVYDLGVFLDAFGEQDKKMRELCNHLKASPGHLAELVEGSDLATSIEEGLAEAPYCDTYDEDDYYFDIPGVKNRRRGGHDVYELISCESWPGHISLVSHLRHWINVWGNDLLEDIAWYKGIPVETIEEVVTYAPGYLPLQDAARDISSIREAAILKEEAIKRARESAERRRQNLEWSRDHFCGLGTRKVKLALNRYVKKGDPLAKALRLALEAEDKNITAKFGNALYVDKIYAVKHRCIEELFETCIVNGYPCGIQKAESPSTTHVAYFDIPGTEQISFHFTPEKNTYPIYSGQWDGLVDSTLDKLEASIRVYLVNKRVIEPEQ